MTKRISRPRKLKIGETEYKVVSRSKSWAQKHQAYGQINYEKKLIEIAPGQDAKEIVDTLTHEIFHSIIDEYDINIDGRSEEAIVTQLANAFTDVFYNNPLLLTWFQNKVSK